MDLKELSAIGAAIAADMIVSINHHINLSHSILVERIVIENLIIFLIYKSRFWDSV